MDHQTVVVGFDTETGLLVSECPDCSFRAGAFPRKRPRIFEDGQPGIQHAWYYSPRDLTPDQWRALGVEPMGDLDLRMGGVGVRLSDD